MSRNERMHRSDAARGQTLAEFAIVIPLFLVAVIGLFDLGRAVFTYSALGNAAREGARLAIVNQDESLVAARAQTVAVGVAIDTTADDLVNYYRKGPNADVETNPECDNSDDEHELTVGCVAVVKPSSTWQAITPLIGTIVGPISLQARSELPLEFVCPDASIPEFAAGGDCPKQP